MKILDLEFKDSHAISKDISSGYVSFANASSLAIGNKLSFAFADTFTFQMSGRFGNA